MTNLIFRLAALDHPSFQLDRRNQAQRLCHFAQVLMEKHEFVMALERLEAALSLQGDLAIAWAGKAQVFYYQRRYLEALHCLHRAAETLEQPVPTLLLEQAKVLRQLGRFQDMLNCCDQSLCLGAQDSMVSFYKVYGLLKLKRYGKLLAGLLPSYEDCYLTLQASVSH